VLSRTYARAVAGTFISHSFDLETAAFAVSYKVTSHDAASLKTEVYLNPEYHYPHGYSVAFSPSSCCAWSMISNVLMVVRCPQHTRSSTTIQR
jgi:hypothetical protein